MPYKTKELRKAHYDKHKDEINRKRREYGKSPKVKKRKAEAHKKWRGENREYLHKYNKKYFGDRAKRERIEVFEHYGKRCICCGESIMEFLTIDHMNGGGEKHRKKIGRKMYRWLVTNNFPEGFQTLCFNCNWGKHINGGVCPHKDKNSK